MNRPTSKPKPVPLARALELFELDPAAGTLTRKCGRGRAAAGSSAVCTQWDERHQEFRTVVWIEGEKFQAPRVLLSIHQGKPVHPHKVVDHINGDPLDNRLENLRAVTRTMNQYNRKDNRAARNPVPADEVDPW